MSLCEFLEGHNIRHRIPLETLIYKVRFPDIVSIWHIALDISLNTEIYVCPLPLLIQSERQSTDYAVTEPSLAGIDVYKFKHIDSPLKV
jgi:hypothetical protein